MPIDLASMSIAEQAAVREAARLELARNDFLYFCRYVKPGFEVSWHHKLLAGVLDRWVKGEIPRLMIFAPPRHGKSELVSRLLPAYLFGKRPATALQAASYSASLARKMNVDAQRIIDTPAYARVFPHVGLGNDNVRTGSFKPKRNDDFFEVCNRDEAGRCGAIVGSYSCAGVGGPLTGTGGDFQIVDDPVKDAVQADSPRQQARQLDWYDSVLYTRLQNPGAQLLMHTRWSTGDLAGRLLERAAKDKAADQWHVVNLPALVEPGMSLYPGDPRGIGDALWPKRFSVERLNKIKASISSRWWSALYDNFPTVASGNIFKRTAFKYYQNLNELGGFGVFRTVVFSLDATFKEGEDVDYVVLQVWGLIGSGAATKYVLLDQERQQIDFVDTLAVIDLMRRRWPTVNTMFVEDKANGSAILSTLRKSPAGRGLRLVAINPTANKVLRYHAAAPIVAEGRVYLPAFAEWLPTFLDEVCNVPRAPNDDQADAFVQVVLECETGGNVDPIERLNRLNLLAGG